MVGVTIACSSEAGWRLRRRVFTAISFPTARGRHTQRQRQVSGEPPPPWYRGQFERTRSPTVVASRRERGAFARPRQLKAGPWEKQKSAKTARIRGLKGACIRPAPSGAARFSSAFVSRGRDIGCRREESISQRRQLRLRVHPLICSRADTARHASGPQGPIPSGRGSR